MYEVFAPKYFSKTLSVVHFFGIRSIAPLRYGNMSSVTIFFVLDQIIRQGHPKPGDYALLQGFGPGLTIELCLLRW